MINLLANSWHRKATLSRTASLNLHIPLHTLLRTRLSLRPWQSISKPTSSPLRPRSQSPQLPPLSRLPRWLPKLPQLLKPARAIPFRLLSHHLPWHQPRLLGLLCLQLRCPRRRFQRVLQCLQCATSRRPRRLSWHLMQSPHRSQLRTLSRPNPSRKTRRWWMRRLRKFREGAKMMTEVRSHQPSVCVSTTQTRQPPHLFLTSSSPSFPSTPLLTANSPLHKSLHLPPRPFFLPPLFLRLPKFLNPPLKTPHLLRYQNPWLHQWTQTWVQLFLYRQLIRLRPLLKMPPMLHLLPPMLPLRLSRLNRFNRLSRPRRLRRLSRPMESQHMSRLKSRTLVQ